MTFPGNLELVPVATRQIRRSMNNNNFDTKNKKRSKRKMRAGEYTTRRGNTRAYAAGSQMSSASWSRNRNIVRHQRKNLGPLSMTLLFGMLIVVMGMIYLTQGTLATSYDYQLSELDSEIAELTAQKEDLAVERARLTSIAAAEQSQVAANMTDVSVSGYVNE